MKLNKFIYLFLFFLITINSYALESNKKNIEIIGNSKISKETIFSIANIKNDIFDINQLNEIKKNLILTNFFSNVDIEFNSDKILIKVVENPLVEFLIISGINERKNILNKIDQNLLTKENAIFSEAILKKDLSFISSYLQSLGYFNNEVDYVVKKLTNNKVNVFIEISLNNLVKIKSVAFLGEKKFPSSTLQDVISSTEQNYFDLFSDSSIPSNDRLNYDISLLKNFYLSKGYFDVQIISANFDLIDKNFVNLNFVINAGNKYTLSNISLINNSKSLQKKNILFIENKLSQLKNKIYSPKIITDLIREIDDFFYNLNLNLVTTFNLEKNKSNSLSLKLKISEKVNISYIKNILVKGNNITEERVIRNKILFSEGDSFDKLKNKRSEDLLRSLNIFKDVKINAINIDGTNDLNLEIEVTEKATGEIAAGAGVSSNGALISFILKENNFLGTAIRSDISLSLGTQKTTGSISVFNPDFSDSGNSLRTSFNVSEFSYDNAGYNNSVIGASLAYGYDIFQNTNFEIGFGLDYDKINAELGASNLIKSRDGDYVTSKVFYNIFNDNRNQKYKTTSGYTLGFSQAIASLISDVPYLTSSIYGSFFKNFSEDYQGTIKYRIKNIEKLGSDPIKLSDRAFLGDSELRGFAYRGYGPKVDNEFIGGNYLYTTTFATTIPNGLPEKWKTSSSIFLDTGSLWGTDFTGANNDNHDFRSSIGIGITWSSPLGPLSLSYAEPIIKNSVDTIETFTFKIGNVF